MMSCEVATKRYPNGKTGTVRGYQSHLYAKDGTCAACREAWRIHCKERAIASKLNRAPAGILPCQKGTKKFPKGRTGTYAGYGAHRQVGEKPCPPCARAAADRAAQYAKLPERKAKASERSRIRYFGITMDQFNAKLASQGGGCAICKTQGPEDKKRFFAVDHDHSCCPGKSSCGQCIRAILCRGCNNGLGCFRDNVTVMAEAIAYVERFASMSRNKGGHSG